MTLFSANKQRNTQKNDKSISFNFSFFLSWAHSLSANIAHFLSVCIHQFSVKEQKNTEEKHKQTFVYIKQKQKENISIWHYVFLSVCLCSMFVAAFFIHHFTAFHVTMFNIKRFDYWVLTFTVLNSFSMHAMQFSFGWFSRETK